MSNNPIDLSDYWSMTPLEQARLRAKVVDKQTCFACPKRATSMIRVGRHYEYVCADHGKMRKR